jgi:hypothetical protein
VGSAFQSLLELAEARDITDKPVDFGSRQSSEVATGS